MNQTRRRMQFIVASAAIVLAVPALSSALPTPDMSVPAERDTEPVVLTGLDFAEWSTAANQTAKVPLMDLSECQSFDEKCKHNNYAEPEVDASTGEEGTPTDRLLGYRWDSATKSFVQIPFQVDEMFTRYLDNSASGFSVYSGQDQHTTYAYDREGFRFTENEATNPCVATPKDGRSTTADPVKGLDHNDELVFMADDAGPLAPKTTPLPKGIEEARRVRLVDPTSPDSEKYVYVMKAAADGPRSAFSADNGYVDYTRDPVSETYEKSESSYDGYGNAARGVVCDAQGNIVGVNERRRPRDYATITTDRYKFRYDGRWLMTDIRISADGGATFGPDLVDRWKARAFQQDPSSETPCCGYEEEDTNWGGSSTLLGERVGPVRAIRETWGADSGTNVIRRETFYRREIRQKNYLRVHVIPPLDGIYAQWDFNAGVVQKFFSSANPKRFHRIDGKNDEVYGNFDDPCNGLYDQNGTSDVDQGFREAYRSLPALCDPEQFEYHQSIDLPDFTKSEFNAAYQWNLVTGPNGSIVDRYQVDKLTDLTAGGTAQSLAAVPYYRDDSCFDDGTGSNPGPRVKLRSSDEPRTTSGGEPRECWNPGHGLPDGSDRFYQGSIATHGLHILAIADSDNARQTYPITEIVAEQRMVMLPGWRGGKDGEEYGRGFEKRLVTVVTEPANPLYQAPPPAPEPEPSPEPQPEPSPSEPEPDPEPTPAPRPAPTNQPAPTGPVSQPPAERPSETTRPTTAVALVPGQTVRVGRSGKAKVLVRCVGRPGQSCRGRLVLRARILGRSFAIGAARFTSRAGSGKWVAVKLSRSGRTLLRNQGKLRATTRLKGRRSVLTLRDAR